MTDDLAAVGRPRGPGSSRRSGRHGAGATDADGNASDGVDRTLSAPTAWPTVTTETRPWTRWWWMGSAVSAGGLERALSRLDEVGIGGVEVTPIYGVRGEEHRNLEHLSPEWLDRLADAARAATDRGMGVDVVPGTGWHFGGPDVDARDATTSVDSESLVVEGDSFEATFDDRVAVAVAYGDDRTVELTDRVDGAGRLEWSVPAEDGPWRVVVVTVAADRQVKRAAPDAEGPMINPYVPGAMRRYLRRYDRGFAGYGGPPLRGTFHDSFEYDAEWSPVLLDSFERRRGYRLQDHLPALLDGVGDEGGEGTDDTDGPAPDAETVARVKADYRRTLSELFEASIGEWTRWSHRNGWLARFQAHCAPGNVLDLYALGDVPETEFIGDRRNLLGSKMASSAAHVTGTRLVSAETATWLDEHFRTSLSAMKSDIDRLFLAGVNHLVYHGTAYSPEDAPWPGWLFYASTQVNPRNPIWRDLPALNDYVTRCQSVLQFGEPDADVLLYWPVEDEWHDTEGLADRLEIIDPDWFEDRPFGRLARRLWEAGYAVDYVSDRQLDGATVRDGRVELPGGDYGLVLVPETDHVPVGTFERLLELAGDGATVGFDGRLPDDVPGLAGLERRRERLDALAASLDLSGDEDEDGDVRTARRGDGRVLVGDATAVAPRADVAREPMVDGSELQFLRRRFDGGTHYFVVNTGSATVDGWVPLAAAPADVARLDPMSGRTGAADWRERDGADGIEVSLRLAPEESVVVRTLDDERVDAAPEYWRPGGEPAAVDGPWELEFVRGGPERPPGAELDELRSWTTLGDAHRRFAGTARYTATFDRPEGGEQWWLDLGTVHESARVWLDGREIGTAIDAPYRLPVEGLAPGEHTLRVEVTSLAANRVRDLDRRGADWKHFEDINLVNRDYEPFDATDWPVRPAGLVGPVQLVPRRVVRPSGE